MPTAVRRVLAFSFVQTLVDTPNTVHSRLSNVGEGGQPLI